MAALLGDISPFPQASPEKIRSRQINVGESAMVVGREYRIPQVVYRAVLGKLPHVLSVISGQPINDRVRNPFVPASFAPLNSFSYLRDGLFFYVLVYVVISELFGVYTLLLGD